MTNIALSSTPSIVQSFYVYALSIIRNFFEKQKLIISSPCNTLTSSYSFFSHAYSLSKVEAWLPAFMQKLSKRLVAGSSEFSVLLAVGSCLKDEVRDDVARCHVKYLVSF